jgi:hypothetical protein
LCEILHEILTQDASSVPFQDAVFFLRSDLIHPRILSPSN